MYDQHAPLRFASRKETRSFNKPWLTKGLLTSISKKNALYKKMLSTSNPSISAKYKCYRNKITHLKESLKQNYYRSKFENCRNDVKKTWKVINEIISTKKSKVDTDTYNTDPNQNHCKKLNIYFSKIGKNQSSKIDPPPATFNDFLIEPFPNLCTFPPTSADEIKQIFASLKCKTTSNSNDIPAKF